MSGRAETLHVLFYQPACGGWYVHSHKTYDTPAQALEAARKFLPEGTTIAIFPVASIELYDKAQGVAP